MFWKQRVNKELDEHKKVIDERLFTSYDSRPTIDQAPHVDYLNPELKTTI